LLLSACSGDPGRPTTLPTLTPSPTASPSTTPTPGDLAAATQVVREYYALLNGLSRTMDSRGLAALMAVDCPCRQQVTAIENARSKSERYVDRVHLVSVTAVRDTSTQVSVLVQYDAAPGGLIDATGRPVTTSPARKGVKRLFRIALRTGRWLIVNIGTA